MKRSQKATSKSKLKMERDLIPQEVPERAPAGWAEVQTRLAAQSGVSILLVEGHQPPALVVMNNNSICRALQSSRDHAKLCDPFCGEAYARATAANAITHYRCHAGLQCFAMPVQLDERDLVAIGGRAFVHSADYRGAVERFRSGDLQDIFSEEVFQNVIFADEADLDHTALRLTQAVDEFKTAPREEDSRTPVEESEVAVALEPTRVFEDPNQLAGTPHDILDESFLMQAIRKFAEQIDASDPAQTYESIVAHSADLLHAERGSLLLLDESSNQLMMTAARGIPTAVSQVAPIAMGQGIAGAVLRENRPLVASVDEIGYTTAPERLYKTKSFISYPIAIGDRRFGVLNLADKIGGGAYDLHDLNLIDLVAPQIALALERAAWQQRANQFQLMSITDPLTGLHNRRYLEARLTEEIGRSKRYNYPLSFMMIDVDDFKFYNDHNGHQAGDRALEITAQCLRAALRKVDVASRYGGEEFSILLPQTSLEEAGVIADRIRRKIMTTNFVNGKSQPLGRVTVSIGLSTFSPSLESAEAIVRAADRALYHAKNHGKNRAYAYQAAPPTLTQD
jgi:diguanylate cyclase (GGDEF)-like protein